MLSLRDIAARTVRRTCCDCVGKSQRCHRQLRIFLKKSQQRGQLHSELGELQRVRITYFCTNPSSVATAYTVHAWQKSSSAVITDVPHRRIQSVLPHRWGRLGENFSIFIIRLLYVTRSTLGSCSFCSFALWRDALQLLKLFGDHSITGTQPLLQCNKRHLIKERGINWPERYTPMFSICWQRDDGRLFVWDSLLAHKSSYKYRYDIHFVFRIMVGAC